MSFDLVITDGFCHGPAAVVGSAADVLADAGATPVALFTAHTMDLDDARAAEFRALIEKHFDLDTLERQLRALLP